jgi:hypothetical protein
VIYEAFLLAEFGHSPFSNRPYGTRNAAKLNVLLVAVFYLFPVLLDVLRFFIVDLGEAGLSTFQGAQ